ncbi:type I-E CRISPR-associated protein Cse1/CasA [Nocardia brasiliensis]|uniref:type I-E CRISPR-associated protein Cse1/CasA n=1 Tax=Nocardia brasiliensis TaxID=37326 RepID=UPI002457F4BE|nr:type I-E CRISPR-associated protein Cse1/CasA [Nocardia brasiliensis]
MNDSRAVGTGVAPVIENFDLTTDPWIPVVRRGAPEELSLTDALVAAGNVELATTDPLETVALLRHVLLPVYWRSVAPPRTEQEWGLRWTGAGWPEYAIRRYLRDHRTRFELFGAEPFGQVASLSTQRGAVKTAAILVLSMPVGNTVPLFAARTDDDPPDLTPAQAVRALLVLQCWDKAGLKAAAIDDPHAKSGKAYGNPTGPLGQFGVVLPLGRNLAETLLLNTPVSPDGLDRNDVPPWESPGPTGAWTTRAAVGPIDLLTWQARRVRLFPRADAAGQTVVRHAIVTRGDRLAEIPSAYEPHAMWYSTETAPRKVPIRHQIGRALWRELPALLAVTKPSAGGVESSRLLVDLARHTGRRSLLVDTPVHVLGVAVSYGNMSAVIDDVTSDSMPLPITALLDDSPVRLAALTIAIEAERLRRAVVTFNNDLRVAAGGRPQPWEIGHDPGEALIYRLTPLAEQLLRLLQRRPECAGLAVRLWRTQAGQLGIEAAAAILGGASDRTFLGVVQQDSPAGGPVRRHNSSAAAQQFRTVVNELLLADDPVDDERKQ